MTLKLRLVEGNIFDADPALVSTNINDPVDHQERIAMRQRTQNFRDAGRFERGHSLIHRGCHSSSRSRRTALAAVLRSVRAAIRLSTYISRAHCTAGLAGVPP